MTDCPLIVLLNGRGSTVAGVGPSLTSFRTHPLNPVVKSPEDVSVTLGDPPAFKSKHKHTNTYINTLHTLR